MRRILITGASGTLGFNVVQLLASDPANCLFLPLRSPAPAELHRHPNVHIQQADLSDTPCIARLLSESQPDLIIHCAASGVRPQREHWFDMVAFNVDATLRLFQASCALPDCEFLYISTGLVYRHQGRPLRESDPVESLHPYGVSKAAADFLLQAAATEFNRKLTILRPFSFTGIHDSGARLFPSLLNAAARGLPFPLSPGEQIRDFCAVNDIAAAVLTVSRRGRAHLIEVFNVGSGLPRTVRSLVEGVCHDLELSVPLHFGARLYHPYEPMHLVADIAALRNTGWSPRTPLSYAVWQLAQQQCPELKLRRPESDEA